MKFFEFFADCKFTLFAHGDSNWDLYIMQYKGNKPCLVSIAKEGTGASDSTFGEIDYLNCLERRGIKHGYQKVQEG